MSLANPGKSGILTVFALIIIIGIPGIVAYADGSDDTYLSSVDVTEPSVIKLKDSTTSTWYSFGLTAVDDGDSGFDIVVDDTDSTSSVSLSDMTVDCYHILLTSGTYDVFQSKVTFATDLEATSVKLVFYGNNMDLATYVMEYDEDSELWTYDVTALDVAELSSYEITTIKFVVGFDSVTGPESSFNVSYGIYEKSTLFTDDVVELIVMIGGIALLICGTFALSFIDVDTPGKAIRSVGRGIRSAGNKLKGRSR